MTSLPKQSPSYEKNVDLKVSTDKKVEDLHKLIENIKLCMMTTRCSDTGKLVSRAMVPHIPANHLPADLWFFTNTSTHKMDELKQDPNVNLGLYKLSTGEWISVSGTAELINDHAKITELYTPDIKTWFSDLEDGVHNGEAGDPRIGIIYVKADTVHYSLKDVTTPVQVWRIVKDAVTGQLPKVPAERELSSEELQTSRSTKKLEE
ncbi:hypothetical protein BDF14DRAFT_1996284 [Spinellus fusiger]|nr:hypothetical protein BDF14DRAFT_1996284 [Spinellus fusiger]